ncbi:hypothetical protein D3C87_1440870 [compost metagenome]
MENITVYFKVHDFDCAIQLIDQKLGINATESWLKGDIIPNRDGKVRRMNSSWILKRTFQKLESVNQEIVDLFSTLNETEIINMSQQYSCELSVVVKMHNENNIGLNFDKGLLSYFSRLGVDLDLDIYMLS